MFRLEPYLVSHRILRKDVKTVLDLGCGTRNPIQHMTKFGKYRVLRLSKVGVDAYLPYLLDAKRRGYMNLLVLADVRYLPFRSKSFDVVMALDLIEHLEKDNGLKLLTLMEEVAKKQVIVFTPVGFLLQEPYDTILQLHRSGWYLKEFNSRGYKCRGINGLFFLRGERGGPRFSGILGTIVLLLSFITEPFVHLIPSIAFQMICFKNIDGDGEKLG